MFRSLGFNWCTAQGDREEDLPFVRPEPRGPFARPREPPGKGRRFEEDEGEFPSRLARIEVRSFLHRGREPIRWRILDAVTDRQATASWLGRMCLGGGRLVGTSGPLLGTMLRLEREYDYAVLRSEAGTLGSVGGLLG